MSAQKYAARPWPSGCCASGERLLLRSATNSRTSLPLSAKAWNASANIALDRVNRATTSLASAVPRFAVSAKITVRRLWVVLGRILMRSRSQLALLAYPRVLAQSRPRHPLCLAFPIGLGARDLLREAAPGSTQIAVGTTVPIIRNASSLCTVSSRCSRPLNKSSHPHARRSMKSAEQRILTINGGSSSIKFALFEFGVPPRRIVEGAIERIRLPEATLRVTGRNPSDNVSRSVRAPDHASAVSALMDWIESWGGREGALSAVG